MQSAVFSGNVSINSKVMFYIVKPRYQLGINANQSHFTWTCLLFSLSFLPQFFFGPLFITALLFLPCRTSLCTYFHSSRTFAHLLPQFPSLCTGLDADWTPPSPLTTLLDHSDWSGHLNSSFPSSMHFLCFPITWVNKTAAAGGQRRPSYSSRTGGY